MHKNQGKNFAAGKQQKRGKRTRKSPKKAKLGAFWVLKGMGTVANRCERMGKPGVRTKVNPIPVQHRQKENRRKPSVFAGFWQGQKDLSRLPPRSVRGRAPLALAHPTTRTAGEPAGAPRCQDVPPSDKKQRHCKSSSAVFGRGRRTWSRLPPRSVRGRAPLALAHPSARGFGVDVGERTREREKADVIRFPPQVPERAVLVWCCELFLEKDCVSTTTSSFERKAPPPEGWPS